MPLGTVVAGGDPNVLVLAPQDVLWNSWLTNDNWQWGKESPPGSNVSLTQPLGTTVVSNGDAYAFALNQEQNTWACWYDTAWQWTDLGQPASNTNVVLPVGTGLFGSNAALFGLDIQGNLWMLLSSQSGT
ncbi:hypothetical protein [Hymenobacter cheonanensis]|uniref:hypothetical protein n=1 Tax=Hymenobacter sp. CA2-7 TaxID=3063993 RepID=UPI002713D408|nr:hypothetical protein [Hymenobacter sp. CA2-7]MDO7885714.1 hypothetical protein [Hymenobacter sp. CA2-7]